MSESIKDILKELAETNPSCLNIIEEQIDVEVQMNYFKRANMLRKQVVTLDETLAKVPILYDIDARLEEKRDVLVQLASFEEVEAFRILEKFKNDAEGEIKLWAAMAYRESKMLLQGSLLDQNQILIASGLGGKGTSLRYFVVVAKRDETPFTEFQERVLREELVDAVEDCQAELESIEFVDYFARIIVLIPLQQSVTDLISTVGTECYEYGDFLREQVLITNVRIFSDSEIIDVLTGKMSEEDLTALDDTHLPYFDVDDNDDDDDEIDDESDDDLDE